MDFSKSIEEYIESLLETDRNKAVSIIKGLYINNIPPETIMIEILIPSLEKLGSFFVDENEKISVAQHFFAAQVNLELTEFLVGKFEKVPEEKGVVVIGTAEGDFHGLGKKIVGACLKCSMYKVIDIGLSCAPEKYIETADEYNADIIAVSSMMLHTAMGENGPSKIRELLSSNNRSKKIKLIVGGAPYIFDDNLYKQVKADGYAVNAVKAIELVNEMVGK
jgi:methanogenic corrinoid protein MtbC1